MSFPVAFLQCSHAIKRTIMTKTSHLSGFVQWHGSQCRLRHLITARTVVELPALMTPLRSG